MKLESGARKNYERHLKLVHNVNDPLILTLMMGAFLLCQTHDIVPFKCKECNFHSSKKVMIEKHWKDTHEVLEYFDCSQCDTCVNSIPQLNQHVKEFHKIKVKTTD